MNEKSLEIKAKEEETKADLVLNEARAIMITSNDEYLAQAVRLKVIKKATKDLEEEMDKGLQPAKDIMAQIKGWFKPSFDKLDTARKIINTALGEWDAKLAKAKAEQEAKLRKENEKKAKELEERAKKAEESGKAEKAEELRSQAAVTAVMAPTVNMEAPKVQGVGVKELHETKHVDVSVLAKFWVESGMTEPFFEVNTAYLNQQARSSKGARKIPGVIFGTKKSQY